MRWSDDITYSGWGRALRATGRLARPERAATLAALVDKDPAPAIGNRRSYGDAALNSGGRAMDMTRMDRILAFDPESGEITVEAGVTISDLAAILAPHGWLPAVMPGTGFATVGGCIGMDVHGKNHHGAGSFGQHVTAMTLLQGGGRRRITPRNKRLWAATCGGLGQTGVIETATLRLTRIRGNVMIVTERRAETWDEHVAMLDASEATYCVGWIDATARGRDLGRGILEEAETGPGLVPPQRAARKVPMDAPHWALSGPVVRAFNRLYYARVPSHGRTLVRPIHDFFFPLDRIHDWNRLYGKRGFHQFQCVVPLDGAAALKAMLKTIALSGLASPLAVLKRMGPGRAGDLSFPMEGYTLAVDFPARDAAAPLIARLIAATQEAGGRIYLAKDSLATPDQVKTMYPDWTKWADEAAKADPDRALQTDMTRRLELRP